MSEGRDFIEINRQCWNRRTDIHVGSAFYDMAGFKAGQSSLKPFELALLGDVAGRSILHLQCHFGQDTLSLARLGAKATGVDFSESAIEQIDAPFPDHGDAHGRSSASVLPAFSLAAMTASL